MNALAQSSKYASFPEKEQASLIKQIWHIFMEDDFHWLAFTENNATIDGTNDKDNYIDLIQFP